MAERLDVTAETVYNWERGRTEPEIRHWAAIIALLGRYPFPTGTTAERLVAYRRQEGLSIAELAALVGADPATVSRWEQGQEPRNRRSWERLQALLAGVESESYRTMLTRRARSYPSPTTRTT